MARRKESMIFGKAKINFIPNFPLTNLCAANNRLIIAMRNRVLLKIELNSTANPEEIDLKKLGSDARISNMFLDPYGEHLLLSFSPVDIKHPAETMYLGYSSKQPIEIPKLKGHIITAVAWNPYMEGTSTPPLSSYPFLIGTSKGLIFEGEIVNSDVKNVKQLFDIGSIGKGSATVISGLEYFFIPKTNKCFILVATSRILYQFKGFVTNREDRPWFSNIFNNYISHTQIEEALEFGELTPYLQTDQSISRLSVLYDTVTAYPKAIGYLTDTGSMAYKDVTTSSVPLDNFLKDIKLIRYPKIPNDQEYDETISASGPNKVPRSLVMTEFHSVMLFRNCVKAVCNLNEEIIFEDNVSESDDKIVNFIRDPVRGVIWFFTERSVHKYTVTNEDRNVWKIYLDKDDFVKAEESCKGDLDKMEQISMRQANYWFERKEYEKSAMYYGLTKASFEEIALKFVQIDNSVALKTFLLKKLSSLQQHDGTQIAVLVLWIVELYLNELGSLRDFGKKDSLDYHNLDEEFIQFMKQNMVKECVKKNKKAIYDLMASHGDKENLVHFTLVMEDFDELIENRINNAQYSAALTTLQKQKDTTLYTKFIPILLDKDPKATIDVLIASGRMLNPIKLLPKFSAKLDADTAREIGRYLEHCVYSLKITEQSVHDYLISLYIYYNPIEKLMFYLEQQGSAVDRILYDPKYALMMCLEKKLHVPTIHLYTIMGLYEEAVALAIQVDLELAKKTADVPENDEEVRKKLWLRIAKHVVKEKNDIQQAMEFLQQCELLKIEDILPFFPNFVTIDHFKDAICTSLQEYNQHIQNLKVEMEEATKSAEVIREEIQGVRNRCAIVRATDECTLCDVPLLIRNFYVFPCGHQFHSDCLMTEVLPQLSQPRRTLLMEYTNKLRDTTMRHEVQSTSSDAISARDQIKSDIDDIVASECLYCGDNMIKLVDVPFISEEEYDRVQKEWD